MEGLGEGGKFVVLIFEEGDVGVESLELESVSCLGREVCPAFVAEGVSWEG